MTIIKEVTMRVKFISSMPNIRLENFLRSSFQEAFESGAYMYHADDPMFASNPVTILAGSHDSEDVIGEEVSMSDLVSIAETEIGNLRERYAGSEDPSVFLVYFATNIVIWNPDGGIQWNLRSVRELMDMLDTFPQDGTFRYEISFSVKTPFSEYPMVTMYCGFGRLSEKRETVRHDGSPDDLYAAFTDSYEAMYENQDMIGCAVMLDSIGGEIRLLFPAQVCRMN